jgi:hypothetical protein
MVQNFTSSSKIDIRTKFNLFLLKLSLFPFKTTDFEI